MAEIVLFHSVLGVTPGIQSAAARLQVAGHRVHVPELYDKGVVFSDYKKAQAYVEKVGVATLLERTSEAVAKVPSKVVYAGFSNGGASAEYMALTKPGAQGVLLFHAALPLPLLAKIAGKPIKAWPAKVPVQVHYSIDDPYRRQIWVQELEKSVHDSGAAYSFCEYPGSGHQFSDQSLKAEYNPISAEAMWSRALSFLSDIDALRLAKATRSV